MSAFLSTYRAELFKAVRKRRAYVLAGLWWILVPALALLAGQVIQVNLGGEFMNDTEAIATAVQTIASPYGMARIGLVAPALLAPTYYIIVIALLAALFVGEERSQTMWTTILVAQPNRLGVLSGKGAAAMTVFGALLAGACLAGIVGGAIGTLFLDTTFAGEWGELLRLYALQWLYGAAGVAFAFLMVFLVRSVALGIVAIFFLPALLEGLYGIYRVTVGFEPLTRWNALLQGLRLRQTLEDLPRYFFTNNLYAPSRAPLQDVVRALGGNPASDDLGPMGDLIGAGITVGHAGWVMAGYFAVFTALLVWLFLRRDVDG